MKKLLLLPTVILLISIQVVEAAYSDGERCQPGEIDKVFDCYATYAEALHPSTAPNKKCKCTKIETVIPAYKNRSGRTIPAHPKTTYAWKMVK